MSKSALTVRKSPKPKVNHFSALSLSDDPDAFHGAPVGLQVVCRRLEEETSLRLAEIIMNACRDYKQ